MKSPILETDAEAIRLAKTLMRKARFGTLATLDPESGAPLATRVATATDLDGTPIILVSALSAHTGALGADPRCSLLVGQPGKGDPLAHPRISISCNAEKLARESIEGQRAARRYLNRHPKARLYSDFKDFAFFRLNPTGAGLNGGFARAYQLDREQLLTSLPGGLEDSEQGAVDHMNADHSDAIDGYARHFAKSTLDKWKLTGIDADGLDLARGDDVERVFFPTPLAEPSQLRPLLVAMAREARGES